MVPGWMQILVVLVLVLVLFGGRGKISEIMGDTAKGIRSFRKGLAEDDESQPAGTIDGKTADKAATDEAPKSE